MLFGLERASLGGLLLSSLTLLPLFLALLDELLLAALSVEFIWGMIVDFFVIVLSFFIKTFLLFKGFYYFAVLNFSFYILII